MSIAIGHMAPECADYSLCGKSKNSMLPVQSDGGLNLWVVFEEFMGSAMTGIDVCEECQDHEDYPLMILGEL